MKELFTDLNSFNLLEELPKAIAIMLIFYVFAKCLDFLTGMLKTWKGADKYLSAKMREGIIKFVGELVAIVFVIGIDMVLGIDFYLTGLTLTLFVYKECGSILENLGQIGVELPDAISEKLEVLNKEDTNENNN